MISLEGIYDLHVHAGPSVQKRRVYGAGGHPGLRVINIRAALTGFTLSRKIVDLCEQAGIRNLHGLQGDTDIGSVASAQLCAAFKNTSHYHASEASFFLLMEGDFLMEPLIIKGGWLELPDKPGLGAEIDEQKFRRFEMK